MELIHADSLLNEVGFVRDLISFDAEISADVNADLADNTWALVIGEDAWSADPILVGHYVYVDGTEWGGRVEGIRHSTKSGELTLTGPTWRGMLYRKVIEPDTGDAYRTVTAVDANVMLTELIETGMTVLYSVSDAVAGVNVTGAWRYENLLTGIERVLDEYGLALRIAYSSTIKRAILSAELVEDLTDTVDLSQDYGADMVTEAGGYGAYNHVIALGSGELAARTVLHLYRLSDGTITSTAPAWAGSPDDLAIIYDYPNAEDATKLLQDATKRLQSYAKPDSVAISSADVDLELGDIVSARDRLTGMVAIATVYGKILKLDERGETIETRVG